jgi:ABC-type nitrate/sulfonate/bicarbonate transport system ATPase subunit
MNMGRAAHFVKTYRAGDIEVQTIKGADFTIERSCFVSFAGPSGNGIDVDEKQVPAKFEFYARYYF